MFREFRKRWPQVRLIFRPTAFTNHRAWVSEGLLDLAFVLEEPIKGGVLQVEALVSEPLLLLAPPDHALAKRPKVATEDLAGEALLFNELGCSTRNRFEHALIAAGVYPATTLEFGSLESIKACVAAGLGLAVLPRVAVEKELAEKRLVALPWKTKQQEIVTQMIWHPDRADAPALKALQGVARKVMGGRHPREQTRGI